MSGMSPPEVAARLGAGLLSFPVTHFTRTAPSTRRPYRDNIGWLAQFDAAGLFAAGGTGEFFSLTLGRGRAGRSCRGRRSPRRAAGHRAGRLRHGDGGRAGPRRRAGRRRRHPAAAALPVRGRPGRSRGARPRGLLRHRARRDHLQPRQRRSTSDTTVAKLAADCPNLIGFKDGIGDIEQMTRIYSRLGDRLTLRRRPADRRDVRPALPEARPDHVLLGDLQLPPAVGRSTSTPRSAAATTPACSQALNDFVVPYCDLRNRTPGYAVSIIKAGMKVIGRPAGPVRPPLTDLDEPSWPSSPPS